MANVLPDHSLTLGTTAESTYGVPSALGGGYEWLETSKLDQDPAPIQGQGLRQGSKFPRADRRLPGISRVSGVVNLELISKTPGKLLSWAFGTGVSTNVSGALYQQLFTATTSTTTMPSFPAQEGIVRADGTIEAFTSSGCCVKSFKISQPENSATMMSFDIDARRKHRVRTVSDGVLNTTTTVTSATANFGWKDIGVPISGGTIPAGATIASVQSPTSITLSAAATGSGSSIALTIGTAYVSPVYASGANLFTGAMPVSALAPGGSLTIGGTLTVPTVTALGSISGGTAAVGVKSWEFALDNGLDLKRDKVGDRSNPTTGMRKGTLTTVIEFDGVTGALLADAQADQTDLALLLNLGAFETIGTGSAQAQFAVPVANIDSGAFPQPTKGDMVKTTVKWSVLDGLSAAQALYFLLRTSDTGL